jgi:hypothetical protein
VTRRDSNKIFVNSFQVIFLRDSSIAWCILRQKYTREGEGPLAVVRCWNRF